MSKFDIVKKNIKSHTLNENIFAYSLIKTGYADNYLAGLVSMYKTYSKMEKKFSKYIGNLEYDVPIGEKMDVIWFCWFQGKDNMPDVTKNCYDSICKYAQKQIVFIDEKNYSDYVTLPDYIIKKWKDGIISYAHFSDILRLELLLEHGGIWLDSTVYLTDNLPSYITDSDFFVYRNGWMDCDMINMGSWLIKSNQNNVLLLHTRNLLYKYWECRNYLQQYFTLHIFFRMVTDKFSDQWHNVPNYPQNDQHLLQYELGTKYCEKRIRQIKQVTSVHKLTNKISDIKIDDDSIINHLDEIYKN